MDVTVGGPPKLEAVSDAEKIGDPVVIQLAADACLRRDPSQRVADEPGAFCLAVEEGMHAKLVAGTNQLSGCLIPQGEAKISSQVIEEAILAPFGVCLQAEKLVRRSVRGGQRAKLGAPVE